MQGWLSCVCIHICTFFPLRLCPACIAGTGFERTQKCYTCYFLISSFATTVSPWRFTVRVTPEAFNLVPVVNHHQSEWDLFLKAGGWYGAYRSDYGNTVSCEREVILTPTERKNNPDAYNAMTFSFYSIFFFSCSFCFCSCSSLLPLFFGLDVNVPLRKVRLFYLFPQS